MNDLSDITDKSLKLNPAKTGSIQDTICQPVANARIVPNWMLKVSMSPLLFFSSSFPLLPKPKKSTEM